MNEAITVAAIAAVPATIAAIASWSTRRTARENRSLIETGNGKTLGTTVHDLAQTVELVAAQNHTNTAELLAIRREHTELVRDFEEHLENVRVTMGAHENLWRQMEEIYAQVMADQARAPGAEPGRKPRRGSR